MPGTDWTVGFAGLLAGVIVTLAAVWLQRLYRAGVSGLVEHAARRAAALVAERDAAQSQADALAPLLMLDENRKRYRAHWDVVDVAERANDQVLKVIEDAQVLAARAENTLMLIEFIRAGGNPRAPWSEIVRWRQQKTEKHS